MIIIILLGNRKGVHISSRIRIELPKEYQHLRKLRQTIFKSSQINSNQRLNLVLLKIINLILKRVNELMTKCDDNVTKIWFKASLKA